MPAQPVQRQRFVPPQQKTQFLMLLQAFQVLTGPEIDGKLFEPEVKGLGAAIAKLAIGDING